MNSNPAVQNVGVIAWDGAAATPVDIGDFANFGFNFRTTADVATDAVFNIQAADADPADKCVPGAFAAAPQLGTCDGRLQTSAQATFIIPAGTVAGTVCSGTLACRPGKFLNLVAAGGDTANVEVVAILQGPAT